MDSTKEPEIFECDDADSNVPDHVHRNLLENVRQLHGKPKITPATRTEPVSEVSEFAISSRKNKTTSKSTFREADLIRAIKKKKPKIAQKLEAAKKTRTLSKPLETVYEKKAQREAGYQDVKTHLDAWNDIVLSNRVADQLCFPAECKKIEVYDHTDGDLFASFTNLTPLEQEFQKLLNSSETSKEEEKKLERSKIRLSLKDMIEQRKNVAKMKAQASYQVAKNRRQNKIKSKKYHRILRREKTKQQIKDFELLQKTDPEAALKQLDQLEKSRAQERATMRHRNTGKWARNQLIKAKYNKESREAISAQIAKNRELTQKIRVESSDSDSGEDEPSSSNRSNNTWFVNEYTEFVNDYKNWKKNNSAKEDSKCDVQPSEEPVVITQAEPNMKDTNEPLPSPSSKRKKICEEKPKCKLNIVESGNEKRAKIRNSSGVWIVTSCSSSEKSCPEDGHSKKTNVSEMFDLLEKKLEQKFKGKLKKIQDAELTIGGTKSTKRQRKRANKKKSVDNEVISEVQDKQQPAKPDKPEPTLTTLESEMPDLVTAGDEALDDEEDAGRQNVMTITDALAADNLVTEFHEEKQKAEEKDKPQVIDITLPGWGTWTDASCVNGKETKKPKYRRVNKRLLFKIPKAPPRKDANKGFVIIKEGISDKLKEHMVSELPYQFTNVKDFEAHIRAPIGRTWLPETAHQQLIAPPIVTKLGTVIEPMDVGELVQREKF